MILNLPGLTDCRRCRRLAAFREELPPRRGWTRGDYWGRPVPGFGDPAARIFLLGLAPGAHGANRTGRPFTGDGAGEFMYPLLYRAGLSNQPEAFYAADGLRLHDLFISNAVKCVPPGNKPAPLEFANCRSYLAEELARLPQLRVVLALGREAHVAYLKLCRERGEIGRLADYPFAHGALCRPGKGLWLLTSYHTSRYNVHTGRLKAPMFLGLLEQAKCLAGDKTVENPPLIQ